MKYRDINDDTPENLAVLKDYEDFIYERFGREFQYPVRLRDWELYEVNRHLQPIDGYCRVLDTGSYNTYLGIWLTRIADQVVISDLIFKRAWKNILRRCRLLPRKPQEVAIESWYFNIKRASSKIQFRNIDLTQMPFADDWFDYITSISVIEHIPQFERAIAEMYRCLKPGGKLLLTTDCSPGGKPFTGGVRYFTPKELDTMFRNYPVVPEAREPDFRPENWCYHRDQPLVMAFVAIKKPELSA